MFTGLIGERGRIAGLSTERSVTRITVAASGMVLSGLRIGDSVAVNGICLTVVNLTGSSFAVEAVPETAAKTTLSEWRIGSWVNLERPLALGDRLDGHLVAGHVDGAVVVRSVQAEGASRRIRFQAPQDVMKYIAAKGSVALDGVSLTVAELAPPDGFSVVLIPHTLSQTSLEDVKPGQKINLEVDLLARYVERLQNAGSKPDGISLERLRSSGF